MVETFNQLAARALAVVRIALEIAAMITIAWLITDPIGFAHSTGEFAHAVRQAYEEGTK